MNTEYNNGRPRSTPERAFVPFQSGDQYNQNFKKSPQQKPSSTFKNDLYMPWPNSVQQTQSNFTDVLGSELDIAGFVDQSVWPLGQFSNQTPDTSEPFDSFKNLFDPWSTNVQASPSIKEEWPMSNTPFGVLSNVQEQIPFQNIPFQQKQQQPFMLPPTPPVSSPGTYTGQKYIETGTNKPLEFNIQYPLQFTRESTPPSSVSNSGNTSPTSNIYTPPMSYYIPYISEQQTSKHTQQRTAIRRRSTESHHPTIARSYRRRASSHPSVASVVSLSAHEPVARVIDGVEYITFLYSHDRLVKEYTVRTDVESVNLDIIPIGFRVQNAIYPRANVPKEEYDGNRWEYETSCNKLGWQLCWLNQDQLCGRRGLIQRAVDSYRNRHAEMRSRRVTRQEKVANGTLRKRRAKKSHSAIL